MNPEEFPRVLSGCRAERGCSEKERCERYQVYLHSQPWIGFNAYHSCIVPLKHFIELKNEK